MFVSWQILVVLKLIIHFRWPAASIGTLFHFHFYFYNNHKITNIHIRTERKELMKTNSKNYVQFLELRDCQKKHRHKWRCIHCLFSNNRYKNTLFSLYKSLYSSKKNQKSLKKHTRDWHSNQNIEYHFTSLNICIKSKSFP